jgi:hypothetical protein
MSETELTWLVLGSILLALISTVRAAHWKAKYETLDDERSTDGWRSEALFLRHQQNSEAAEFAEYN